MESEKVISVGNIKTPTKKGDQVTVYFKDGTSGEFIAENDLTSTKVGIIGNRAFTDAQPVVQLEIKDIFRSANSTDDDDDDDNEKCFNYFSVTFGSSTVQNLGYYAGEVWTAYNGTRFKFLQLAERVYLVSANLKYVDPDNFSGSLYYGLIGQDMTEFTVFTYSGGSAQITTQVQFDHNEFDIVHQGNVAWGFPKLQISNASNLSYLLPRLESAAGTGAIISHSLGPNARFGNDGPLYGSWTRSVSDTISTTPVSLDDPPTHEPLNPGGHTTASGSATNTEHGIVYYLQGYLEMLALKGQDYIQVSSIGNTQTHDVDQIFDFKHTGLSESSDGVERSYTRERKGFYKQSLFTERKGELTVRQILMNYYQGHPTTDGDITTPAGGRHEWQFLTYVPDDSTIIYQLNNGSYIGEDFEEYEFEEKNLDPAVITDFLTLETRQYKKEYRKSTSSKSLTGGYIRRSPNSISSWLGYGFGHDINGFTKTRGQWTYDPPNQYVLFIGMSSEHFPTEYTTERDSDSWKISQDFQKVEETDYYKSIINTGSLGIFRETIRHEKSHNLYDADYDGVTEFELTIQHDQSLSPVYGPADPNFRYKTSRLDIQVFHDQSLGPPASFDIRIDDFPVDTDFYKFVYPGIQPTVVKNPGVAFFAQITLDEIAKVHNHLVVNGNGSFSSFTIEVDFDYSNAISSREPEQFMSKVFRNESGSDAERIPFDPEDIRVVDLPSQDYYIVNHLNSTEIFYLSRCKLISSVHEDKDLPGSSLNPSRVYEKMTFQVQQSIVLDTLTFIAKDKFEKSNRSNCFIFTPDGAAIFNFINERQCNFYEDPTGRKFICASPYPLKHLPTSNVRSFLDLALDFDRYNTLIFEIQGDEIKLLAIQKCKNITNFNLFRDEHDWTQFVPDTIPGPNDTIFNVI